MRRVHTMPVVAAVLLAAACGGNDGPTPPDTQVSVRFVNLTSGMSGSGGFTANAQFVPGSVLPSGQVAQTCAKLNGGQTFFGFGAANTAGTGLSGFELTTLQETISKGGDYTVVAAGSATSPTLHLFSNGFSGSLGTNQAAVRFVSFVPPMGTTVYNYVFYKGAIEGGNTPLVTNLPFGVTSGYTVLTSGANSFSALQTPGATILLSGSPLTLQASSVNTIAAVRDASGAFQLINLPRCS